MWTTVIGGGLAGCEAAWQLLTRGFQVKLYEMKPTAFSPAHKSSHLAELVCSNSLGSNVPDSASGILKKEMRILNSIVLAAADATSVPAGRALAVDRLKFSQFIESRLGAMAGLQVIREEMTRIPEDDLTIIATGPLTSAGLSDEIALLTGSENLHFYDAISPIVEGDSIDLSRVFQASRYCAEEGDYLNCPFTKEEYENFWHALITAEKTAPHPGEDVRYFEACLPIEVLAARGKRSLLFGPMKPVGLTDPRTGRKPYAVVQLRKEDREGRLFNLVGFQTKMTRTEQARVFRLIPGLSEARFARWGSIHRNSFISAPRLLNSNLQLIGHEKILFAGQLTGVEGYVESSAMGLLAGINAAGILSGKKYPPPPPETAIGALLNYLITSRAKDFQPMNINLGLFSPLPPGVGRKEKGRLLAERSERCIRAWLASLV